MSVGLILLNKENDGRFRAIQIRVERAPIEFHRVVVHYGNGSDEQIEIRSRIKPGGYFAALLSEVISDRLEVTVKIALQGAALKIQGGKIKEIKSAAGQGEVEIRIEGAELLKAELSRRHH
jgi:hypothetical protein